MKNGRKRRRERGAEGSRGQGTGIDQQSPKGTRRGQPVSKDREKNFTDLFHLGKHKPPPEVPTAERQRRKQLSFGWRKKRGHSRSVKKVSWAGLTATAA